MTMTILLCSIGGEVARSDEETGRRQEETERRESDDVDDIA